MNRPDFLGQLDAAVNSANAKLILNGIINEAGVQIGVVERPDGSFRVMMADVNPQHTEIEYKADLPRGVLVNKEGDFRLPVATVMALKPLGQTAMHAITGLSSLVPHPRHSVPEGSGRNAPYERWNQSDNPYTQPVELRWREGSQPTLNVGDREVVVYIGGDKEAQ